MAGLLFASAGATADETKGTASIAVSISGEKLSGEVSSDPSGISCPSQCLANVQPGEQYTLTATAGSGSPFAGFSGACTSATTTCTFTTTEGRNLVEAAFVSAPAGDDQACDKAKAKLAKAKKKLADLRADDAPDSRIDAAVAKVKAKEKKEEACAA